MHHIPILHYLAVFHPENIYNSPARIARIGFKKPRNNYEVAFSDLRLDSKRMLGLVFVYPAA
jgi:hypothetical protein